MLLKWGLMPRKTLGQGKGLSMDLDKKRDAIFQTLFDETKKEIEKVYLPGTMAYIKTNHNKLYYEVLVTEMRLDDLWLSMRQGKNTMDKFREALKSE